MLDPIYLKIGQNIQRIRRRKDFTQESLALEIGLARTSIVHIENGKQRLSIDRLYKIAKTLNEPINVFLPVDNISKDRMDDFSINRISNKEKKTIDSLIEEITEKEKNG